MDLNRLTKGEKLAGIAALVLFILSFVPMWASFGTETDIPEAEIFGNIETKTDYNAWSGYGFTMTIAMILCLVIVALVIARAAGALDRVNLPAPLGVVLAGAGALVLLIMLFSLLTGPSGQNEVDFGGVKYVAERGLLLYVGILLAAATALGGFLHMKEEGSTPAQLGGTGTGTGPAGPPPQRPPGT